MSSVSSLVYPGMMSYALPCRRGFQAARKVEPTAGGARGGQRTNRNHKGHSYVQ